MSAKRLCYAGAVVFAFLGRIANGVQHVDLSFESPVKIAYGVNELGSGTNIIVYDKIVEDGETFYGVTQKYGTNRLWISQTESYKGGRSLAATCYAEHTYFKDRAEFRSVQLGKEYALQFGQEMYYGYAMKIDSNSTPPTAGLHVMQAYQNYSQGQIPLTLSFNGVPTNGVWRFLVHARTLTNTCQIGVLHFELGRWYKCIWKLRPAYPGFGSGEVSLWIDDQQVVSWQGNWGHEPTGEMDKDLDLRCGIYRGSCERQQTIFYDQIKYADTYYEADPDVDIEWAFRFNDTDGWKANKDIEYWLQSNNRGYGELTGNDSQLYSPDQLNISADEIETIRVRMQVAAGNTPKIFFSTQTYPSFTNSNMVSGSINTNEVAPGDDKIYEFNMSANTNWTGVLKQLRLDPADTSSSGSFSIDYIDLVGDIVARVSDAFTRTDTSYSTNGSNIGINWVATASEWKISGNTLAVNGLGGVAILYDDSLETVSGNGAYFTVSADVAVHMDGGWAGIVFHYQNPSNYYVLRIKPGSKYYQLLNCVNGVNATVLSKSDAPQNFVAGTPYTLAVTSVDEHVFNFTITEAGSSTVLNGATTLDDTVNGVHSGGYAGLYNGLNHASTNPDSTFDNFDVSVGPPSFLNLDVDWKFDSGTEGWSAQNDITAWSQSGKAASGTISGSDSQLLSPDNLNIYCDPISKFLVKMRNASVATNARVYYTTTTDPVFDDAKSTFVNLKSNNAGFALYDFNLDGTLGWKGNTLKQLRFDPAIGASAGTFSIEFMDLYGRVAHTATDHFDRSDTSYSTNGSNIGINWVATASEWKISGNTLAVNGLGGVAILYDDSLETVSGNGAYFTMSADVAVHLDGGWAGIVFHYQNSSNYYVLRIKPGSKYYQLLNCVNGVNATVLSKSDAPQNFVAGTPYTLAVTSLDEHVFNFTITEAGSSTVLNGTTTLDDTVNGIHNGGYAGLYNGLNHAATNPDSTYDNFFLEAD